MRQQSESGLKATPTPKSRAGQRALQALIHERSVLSALEAIHAEMGNIFQMPLPGFNPIFLVGPQANRFVAVTARDDLRWRVETDPVARLLRDGLLVTDGERHDTLRRHLSPPLHRGMLAGYIEVMIRRADQVICAWPDGSIQDMLVEMRKVALNILVETLFQADFAPDLQRMWPSILKTIDYISPGLWLIVPWAPRPGYRAALKTLDQYLFHLIDARRKAGIGGDDMLSLLVRNPDMDDDLIRDQLLTMLIAGHDTSTALLAWTLYYLGRDPELLAGVRCEVDQVLGQSPPTGESIARLEFLDRVISETLRLYPPIHIGNRLAACDLEFQGYRIPAGTRTVYSIYLTHRMPEYWPDPHRFDPERFMPEQVKSRPPYTYMPFGGGARNCIGMAFAQVEVKVVLARILQTFDLRPHPRLSSVHAHMGATLEPRPGVPLIVAHRR
jgi:cytochrome P450